MKNKQSKIDSEKDTLSLMIKIYCKKNHHSQELCEDCNKLLAYAINRLNHCRYGEKKSFCNRCTSHCYKIDKKEAIRKVMRFSGPRMFFYDPQMVIKHLLSK